jgi:hypothetical protein
MNHRTYWRFLFRKNLSFSIVILSFYLIASVSIGGGDLLLSSFHYYGFYGFGEALLNTFLISGYFVSLVVPLLARSRYCSRSQADIYLSLPVSRKGSWIDDALFGFLQTFLPWCFSFFLSFLLNGLTTNVFLSQNSLWIVFAFGVMAVLSGYLLGSGVVAFANNLLDGFLLLIGAVILPLAWGSCFLWNNWIHIPYATPQPYSSSGFDSILCFFPIASISETAARYALALPSSRLMPLWIPFLHLALSAGYAFLGYAHFQKWKGEEAGSLSTSPWGYPVFLYGSFFAFFALISPFFLDRGGLSENMIILTAELILVFVYFVFYFISIRKIVFNWKGFFIFATVFLSGSAFGLLCRHFSS